MPPTIVTPPPSVKELEASNIGSSSGNSSSGIKFVPYNSKKAPEFDEGRNKFRHFREKNERNNFNRDPSDSQVRKGSNPLPKDNPANNNRFSNDWNNYLPKNNHHHHHREASYPRRHSGSNNTIRGRNLPPRIRREQAKREQAKREHAGNSFENSSQPRKSFTNSRGENSRGELTYRKIETRNHDYSKDNNNDVRREYVRGENFRRVYDTNHSQQNNNNVPGFTFDSRLPNPNSIGMFTPTGLDDGWMKTPMNQLFEGYNHHKHGQQFTMNDFMCKKDNNNKAETKSRNEDGQSAGSIPFNMEQMQFYMMGMWQMQQMQQQQYNQMLNQMNNWHTFQAGIQQHQMRQSQSNDRISQKSKKSAPPPGFANANDRDNLSDITRSSNSTLPSELNDCAVQEALSSTAKKPSNANAGLNSFPRNIHPNSPYHRKTSNIPNPFSDKSYDSKLNFCIEKHDGPYNNSNWGKNEPIGSKRTSSSNNKEDKSNTVKFFDFDNQTSLFGEKSLFDDKNCGGGTAAPDFSFNDAAGDGSFNKIGNTNSSFVNNMENSNFSVFDQSKQSSDVSGMKTSSGFGNDLRTSGYLTNDSSKNMSHLLNESEPRIGEEFNIKEVHENNQTIRLQRVFGEFYCRECDRAWASQNVWVIEGTKKVYVKRTCNQCHKITEPWYTNPSN